MAWLRCCRQLTQIIVVPPSWSARAPRMARAGLSAPRPWPACAAGRPARAARSSRVRPGHPGCAWSRFAIRAGADQHGGVPVAVVAVDGDTGQVSVRGGARDGEQPVRVDQVVDGPGHLHPAAGEHDQPVAEPLQLSDDVRGDDDGEAGFGRGGHHVLHELQPRDRVQAGDRLVEHEQRRALGQGHGQRDLRLLTAGQGLDLALERDAQRLHARRRPVPGPSWDSATGPAGACPRR